MLHNKSFWLILKMVFGISKHIRHTCYYKFSSTKGNSKHSYSTTLSYTNTYLRCIKVSVLIRKIEIMARFILVSIMFDIVIISFNIELRHRVIYILPSNKLAENNVPPIYFSYFLFLFYENCCVENMRLIYYSWQILNAKQ